MSLPINENKNRNEMSYVAKIDFTPAFHPKARLI